MTGKKMSLLGGNTMGWFGPSKDEVWGQLCHEVGGELVDGGFWKAKKVQVHTGPWTIVLDTYTVSEGESSTTYTRMRVPFLNPGGFRFVIYRKGLFSGLGKFFGMQDIEVGDPEFDEAFIIQGNDEGTVYKLLADPKIRQMIQAQPKIRLEIKDNEGWFGPKFPEDVDELLFQVPGVIKDVARLKSLFDLFAAVLDQLSQIRAAYKQAPDISL
jgi:hypothetical protein